MRFAIGTLAALALVGPGFAAEPARQNTIGEPPAPPAKKPSSHVTGNVVAINRSAQMLTVKGPGGALVTLTADAAVAPQLTGLKKGERVKVAYKNSHGQQIATRITPG